MSLLFGFDIDDTLYDLAEPYRRAWNKHFSQRFDLPVDELFLRSRLHSDEAYELVVAGKESKEYMHIYRVVQTLSDYGVHVSDEDALEFQRLYEHYQQSIEVSPDVATLLDYVVSSGIPFGFITNGDKTHQRHKAELLGLSRWVCDDAIVISGEIGAAKPSRKPFDELRERLSSHNHNASELWFFGDTFETDVVGAKQAGWHCVWFNRRSYELPHTGPIPEMIVEDEASFCSAVRAVVMSHS